MCETRDDAEYGENANELFSTNLAHD